MIAANMRYYTALLGGSVSCVYETELVLPTWHRLSKEGNDPRIRRRSGSLLRILHGAVRRTNHGLGATHTSSFRRSIATFADARTEPLSSRPPSPSRWVPSKQTRGVPVGRSRERTYTSGRSHLVRIRDLPAVLLDALDRHADPSHPSEGIGTHQRSRRTRKF